MAPHRVLGGGEADEVRGHHSALVHQLVERVLASRNGRTQAKANQNAARKRLKPV